jgi:hypothetical protein
MNSHTMRDEIALPYRLMTLMLLLILGMEFTEPLIARSQVQSPPPSGGTAQTPVVSQDTPPNQEAESIEERKPFYKTWWFWTLVGLVVVGALAASVAVQVANDPPSPGLGSAAQP